MHDHTYVEPEQTIFLAGERVVAGHYRRLDAEWIIHLETGDFLPASLDGHVACYVLTAPAQDLISAGVAVVIATKRFQEDGNVQEDTRVR